MRLLFLVFCLICFVSMAYAVAPSTVKCGTPTCSNPPDKTKLCASGTAGKPTGATTIIRGHYQGPGYYWDWKCTDAGGWATNCGCKMSANWACGYGDKDIVPSIDKVSCKQGSVVGKAWLSPGKETVLWNCSDGVNWTFTCWAPLCTQIGCCDKPTCAKLYGNCKQLDRNKDSYLDAADGTMFLRDKTSAGDNTACDILRMWVKKPDCVNDVTTCRGAPKSADTLTNEYAKALKAAGR